MSSNEKSCFFYRATPTFFLLAFQYILLFMIGSLFFLLFKHQILHCRSAHRARRGLCEQVGFHHRLGDHCATRAGRRGGRGFLLAHGLQK